VVLDVIYRQVCSGLLVETVRLRAEQATQREVGLPTPGSFGMKTASSEDSSTG
jgi:hypothetical protein